LSGASWSVALQGPSGTWGLAAAALTLVALVLAAAAVDVRSHRIPNRLVIAGALTGILFQIIHAGLSGCLDALAGIAVGMGLFLPLYALRAMGAGDVKLMGMVGAFVGPGGAVAAVLLACVAGGVLALAVALRNGQLGRLFWNLRLMLTGSLVGSVSGGRMEVVSPAVSVGKLAYGVAIATGTVAYVLMARLGVALV
jgi:prepilin peptidase CpaA